MSSRLTLALISCLVQSNHFTHQREYPKKQLPVSRSPWAFRWQSEFLQFKSIQTEISSGQGPCLPTYSSGSMKPETFILGTLNKPFQSLSGLKCLFSVTQSCQPLVTSLPSPATTCQGWGSPPRAWGGRSGSQSQDHPCLWRGGQPPQIRQPQTYPSPV